VATKSPAPAASPPLRVEGRRHTEVRAAPLLSVTVAACVPRTETSSSGGTRSAPGQQIQQFIRHSADHDQYDTVNN
jgi:hypothetical protein